MARVAPLEKEHVNDQFKDLFEKITTKGGKILNIYKTVAHCPAIGFNFLRLGNAILLKGNLSPRLRELAILRVGHLARATYEISQHIPMARRAGLTESQIEAIFAWHDSLHFNLKEKALLQYTDEVSQNIRAKDDTFKNLETFFSQQQIVELTLTIGYYGMVCRLLETLQIELEKS